MQFKRTREYAENKITEKYKNSCITVIPKIAFEPLKKASAQTVK